jgi:serine/threonine protein kinase
MSDDSPQFMPTALAPASSPPSAPRDEPLAEEADVVPSHLEPGDFIGRYRIRERIGEGGMGVVHAAEDPELGRVVAIKLLRPVHGSEAEVHQRRLLREAQALARVSHHNLVTVYDVGTHEGRVWIAMEYVVGDTLDVWLRRRRRSWQEIIGVFLEAGRGLAAVHAAGLIHRDFKPGNVLVGSEGTVQVLDFGLAARAGEPSPDDDPDKRATPDLDALAATLTTTGGIMGTPAYMAPEQFLRLGADARADQFSFCVALFEALYGRRPWKGRDLAELMVAVVGGLTEKPPTIAGMPDEVRRVLQRGLRSSPEERFRDMSALLEVLEAARAPTPVRSTGGWRRYAFLLVGGGVLTLAGRQWLAADERPSDPPEAFESVHATDPAPTVEEAVDTEAERLELPAPDPVNEIGSLTEVGTTDALAELPGIDEIEAEGSTGADDGSALPSVVKDEDDPPDDADHGLAGLPDPSDLPTPERATSLGSAPEDADSSPDEDEESDRSSEESTPD